MRNSRFTALAVLGIFMVPFLALAEVVPGAVPDIPVLGAQALRGGGLIKVPAPPINPITKVVDGNVEDWKGTSTRYAGTSIYSAGEYVYSDFLMDDWGADDGADATRVSLTDPLNALEPRTYRSEALSQAVGDEFGVPGPREVASLAHYGDSVYPTGLADHADLVEARVAVDANKLYFVVRTQSMTRHPGTAVLVLIDTQAGGSYEAPGGLTAGAEYVFLAAGNAILDARASGLPIAGCPSACPGVQVASDISGFNNAIEIGVERSVLGSIGGSIKVGIAAGVVNAAGGLATVKRGSAKAEYLNVAFRSNEPSRVWMDHDQALALHAGNIDQFLDEVDLGKLETGYTQSFEPRPGYWERIYESDSPVNQERESRDYFQGPFQQYGLYIPTSYRPDVALPATFWLHFNGGHAHDAAAWIPGLLRQLGEARGNIVVSPGARGSSSGYTGRGLVDFIEVFDDVTTTFSIDRDKVYLSGYSLGGFAVYLYGLLLPDLFAAAFPTVGPAAARPPTFVPTTPLEDVMTLQSIIENARNLPFVIYHGTNDEIIPFSDIVQQAARFAQLGYRHRFYVFPGYEHYSFAVVDDWQDAARYLDTFSRDPNPPRVTYHVWPAMENLVNTDNTPVPLDFRFDRAYWVSELAVRTGDPLDPGTVGTFDGQSLGRGDDELLALPEFGAGLPPSGMTGMKWVKNGRIPSSNEILLTVTNLASARLDLARMGIATEDQITINVSTDGDFELRLDGDWLGTPTVSGATIAGFNGDILRLSIPAGSHEILVSPS